MDASAEDVMASCGFAARADERPMDGLKAAMSCEGMLSFGTPSAPSASEVAAAEALAEVALPAAVQAGVAASGAA